jgi:hypothetical protein
MVCRRLAEAPEELLKRLAADPEFRDLFWERERERVSDPEKGFQYFLKWYASHIGADGKQEPLYLWPFQVDLADRLASGRNLISVKSRRVGMTVIVLHYAIWLAAFKEGSELGELAIFSINAKKAKKTLKLARKILAALPKGLISASEYGAGCGATDTQEELGFKRGSTLQSYPSNGGARGDTLLFAFLDEFARIEGPLDAAQELKEGAFPATEGGGQLVVASTGRGRSGRGAVFAELWDQAESGELDWATFFVGRFDRPGRDGAWWKQKIIELGQVRAEQEYPEDPEQALSGDAEGKLIPASHVNAAIQLGREFRALWDAGEIHPKYGAIWEGIDWGGYSTVVVVMLVGSDLYVAAEQNYLIESATTVAERSLDLAESYTVNPLGKRVAKLTHIYYDSSGKQQAIDLRRVVKMRSPHTRPVRAQFNEMRKYSVQHLIRLLEHTVNGQPVRIGIDPSCKELIRQMKDGDRADDGDRKKGDDHTFDALIAAIAEHAKDYDRALARMAP